MTGRERNIRGKERKMIGRRETRGGEKKPEGEERNMRRKEGLDGERDIRGRYERGRDREGEARVTR